MNIQKMIPVLLLAGSGLCVAAEDIDVAMYDEAYIYDVEKVDIDVAMYDEAYDGLPGNEKALATDISIGTVNELPATAAGTHLVNHEDCNG